MRLALGGKLFNSLESKVRQTSYVRLMRSKSDRLQYAKVYQEQALFISQHYCPDTLKVHFLKCIFPNWHGRITTKSSQHSDSSANHSNTMTLQQETFILNRASLHLGLRSLTRLSFFMLVLIVLLAARVIKRDWSCHQGKTIIPTLWFGISRLQLWECWRLCLWHSILCWWIATWSWGLPIFC